MLTTDAEMLDTTYWLLGLNRQDLDRLARLRWVLPFDLAEHLTDNLVGETGLLASRVNAVLHERIWQSLLKESEIEATALGAFGIDRSFLVWSPVRVGSFVGAPERTAEPLRRLLGLELDWSQFVDELNRSLRPPRGAAERKRDKARREQDKARSERVLEW